MSGSIPNDCIRGKGAGMPEPQAIVRPNYGIILNRATIVERGLGWTGCPRCRRLLYVIRRVNDERLGRRGVVVNEARLPRQLSLVRPDNGVVGRYRRDFECRRGCA